MVNNREKTILKYPIVETNKGAIFSQEEFDLAGGAVKDVRGYIIYQEGDSLKAKLEVNGKKVKEEVPIPINKLLKN